MDGSARIISLLQRIPPPPRMAPEQCEALAAVAYAAVAEYAWRCLGEERWPEWGCAAEDERALWMRRVARQAEGLRLRRDLWGFELSEVRRYRLLHGVVAALTAVA